MFFKGMMCLNDQHGGSGFKTNPAFNADDGYLPSSLGIDHKLWGRRSVFFLHGNPLLVSEVFLPALCAQLAIATPNNQ